MTETEKRKEPDSSTDTTSDEKKDASSPADDEEEEEVDAPAKKQKSDDDDDGADGEGASKSFLSSLETKNGEPVDPSTLDGKLVVLYFSSSWCGACRTFTPLLSVLYDEMEEDEDLKDTFEVVYVSSDDTVEMCNKYMNEKHSNWLRIPYSGNTRHELKLKYGVFAGKERGDFPSDTQRRSGIPTLVVVGKDGTEHVMLDCDNSKVIEDIESKGTDFLNDWLEKYKW